MYSLLLATWEKVRRFSPRLRSPWSFHTLSSCAKSIDNAANGREKSSTTDTNNEYVLRRNYRASTRLNCQFYLWKEELGFNIHPLIPPPASEAQIADLATGTAIWLIDVARTLPGRRFAGFDISLQQCPPRDWLPQSISLHEWDIYSDPPPELEGQFDIVHIRLLLLVVRENDPGRILRNVMRILKPGGYLQWDELDVFSAFVASTNDNVDTARFQKAQELANFTGLQWVRKLKTIVEANGFEGVVESRYECDLTLAKFYQDMQMMVMEETAMGMKDVSRQERIYSAIKMACTESSKGMARCVPKLVVVARKP